MAQLRNAVGRASIGAGMGRMLPASIDPRTGLPGNTGFAGGKPIGEITDIGSDSPAEDGIVPQAPPPDNFEDEVRTGSSQGPRERESVRMRTPGAYTMSPPSAEGQMGALMSPDMPDAPTPLAGMGAMASGASAFPSPKPFQLNQTPGKGLYGKAGGLLGGGQSVAGMAEKGEGLPSELLALLALLGQ